MSARIVFSDAPPEAIQTTTVLSTGADYYAEPGILTRGANTGALATGELNSWGLTSDFKVWSDQQIGYWSASFSNNNCVFATAPTITLNLGGVYSTSGLTFRFAPSAGEYCRKIFVEWFNNDVVIASGDYFPNAGDYVVERLVENFDKVKVSLKETNLPNRRAKLEMLGIGIVRDYSGDRIIDLSIDREVDLMALSLPISSVDVTLQTPAPANLYFFKRQIIDVYLDDAFEGRYFVENSQQYSETKYKITANDLISELEQYQTDGGFWGNTAVPLSTHLENLSTDALFKYELSESLKTKNLNRGTEERITVREAVTQIAFAADAIVVTSGTDKISLIQPGESTAKKIEARDTFYGGTIEQRDYITSVSLTSYENADNVEENTPYVDVYFMIDYPYWAWFYKEKQQTQVNPNAEAARLKNNIVVDECYFMGAEQANDKLGNLYQYYMRRKIYKFAHVVRGEKPGDLVEVTLPWGGIAFGHIVKMKTKASSLTVSDTEVLLL